MHMLHRISVWGLLAGWLMITFGAKTLRGDAAGLWIRLDIILVIGMGLLLISAIGIIVATFARRSTAGRQQLLSEQDESATAKRGSQ